LEKIFSHPSAGRSFSLLPVFTEQRQKPAERPPELFASPLVFFERLRTVIEAVVTAIASATEFSARVSEFFA